MSNLERAQALITEAAEEIGTLRYQHDQQRVEIHQVRQRLQREQDRSKRLDDQVADLELRLEQAEQRVKNARAATLAHASRTT